MMRGRPLRLFFAACALGVGALTAGADTLLDGARNIAILNEGNLKPVTYVLPTPAPDAVEIDLDLRGSVLGIPMIRANYTGWMDGTTYAAYADLKTSGLAALLKKLEIWSVTTGRISRAGFSPRFHVQQNRDKKNRRVEMNYDDAARKVDVVIVPRLGSQGKPPATPEERYSADDTVSAVMHLMTRGGRTDGPLCAGALRVFDSKQHYDLRMEQAGTRRLRYKGKRVETLRCKVYYEPISGFDPEDLPSADEYGTPVNVYLRRIDALDMHVPMRLTYKVGILTVVVRLHDMQIRVPD